MDIKLINEKKDLMIIIEGEYSKFVFDDLVNIIKNEFECEVKIYRNLPFISLKIIIEEIIFILSMNNDIKDFGVRLFYKPQKINLIHRKRAIEILEQVVIKSQTYWMRGNGRINKPAIDTIVRKDGWVTCPNCRKHFAVYGKQSWDGIRHLTCGIKLNLVKE